MLRILAVVLLLTPTLALADQATADACAANLPADARTIYAAVVANFAAGDAHPDVRAKIMGLAREGKIDRGAARTGGRRRCTSSNGSERIACAASALEDAIDVASTAFASSVTEGVLGKPPPCRTDFLERF